MIKLVDFCDEILAHVVSYVDFDSAILLVRGTSKSVCKRFRDGSHIAFKESLWRAMFERHGFVGCHESTNDELIEAIRQRRAYSSSLFGIDEVQCQQQDDECPFKTFFVPVVPSTFHSDRTGWPPPPPPIYYEHPSFRLVDSTSSRLAFLDPFDSSLVVHACCVDHAFSDNDNDSDDIPLIDEIPSGFDLSLPKASPATAAGDLGLCNEEENGHKVTTMEDERIINNKVIPARRVLIDHRHFDNVSVQDYYPEIVRNNGNHMNNADLMMQAGGIYSKVTPSGQTFIATVHALFSTAAVSPVTEVHAWSMDNSDTEFVCRVRSLCSHWELCPKYKRLYMVISKEWAPEWGNALIPPEFLRSGKVISVYPLEQVNQGNTSIKGPKHFPQPLFSFESNGSINDINVTGDLIFVATNTTMEVWKTRENSGVGMLCSIEIRKAVEDAVVRRNYWFSKDKTFDDTASHPAVGDAGLTKIDNDQEIKNRVEEHLLELLAIPISSFHIPSNVDNCGIVTLHFSHRKCSTAILWRKSSNQNFEIVGAIHLPVPHRMIPRVHYDGRRLILLSMDRSNELVIFVYHVLNTFDDEAAFRDGTKSSEVYHFADRQYIRKAAEFRHAGLGGLESFDFVQMTCNDCYIVVNTKNGNFLGNTSSSPTADGLFVFELQDL